MGGVGVVESLSKSVDEDTRVRVADDDAGVGAIGVIDGKETSTSRARGVVERNLLGDGARSGGAVVGEVGLHCANANSAEEGTLGSEETVDEDSEGDENGGVDAILNTIEDGDKDTGKEDGNLKRGYSPELVDDARRSDNIPDGVDDDGSESSVGNVPEDGSQSVESKKDDNGSNDTSERSSDTSLGLDGSSGERTGSGVGTEERTEQVGDTNGNKFLGGVDNVVVDTTKRFGDGDVLNKDNDDSGGKLTKE